MSFRYVSCDIETTGLDPLKDSILEFGAVLDDLSNPIDVDKLPVFHCYFIQERYTGQPQALSMHPTIFKRIADREKGYNYVSPTKFGNLFKQFLIKNGYESKHDKVVINVAGKNFGSFDLQFLKHQTDIEKHVEIRAKILDPAILYFDPSDESLPGLSNCKVRAGLSEKVNHNAIDDAKDVVLLIRKLIK